MPTPAPAPAPTSSGVAQALPTPVGGANVLGTTRQQGARHHPRLDRHCSIACGGRGGGACLTAKATPQVASEPRPSSFPPPRCGHAPLGGPACRKPVSNGHYTDGCPWRHLFRLARVTSQPSPARIRGAHGPQVWTRVGMAPREGMLCHRAGEAIHAAVASLRHGSPVGLPQRSLRLLSHFKSGDSRFSRPRPERPPVQAQTQPVLEITKQARKNARSQARACRSAAQLCFWVRV